jgi:hypothetical protein
MPACAKQAALHLSALTFLANGVVLERARVGSHLGPQIDILTLEGSGVLAMSRVKVAVLAACLLGPLLAGCGHSEPAPHDFTLVDQRPAKAEEAGNTLDAAEKACKEETKTKGISNVLAIFSRFRQGSADKDYVACMKRRGYEVKQ